MARTQRKQTELDFGERLRTLLVQARENSEKSVREAAAAAEVSVHGLYAVERGQVLSPGIRTVYLLSREYGMDLTDLARQAEGARP